MWCRPRETYSFEVAATNSCGTSLFSHPVKFTTKPGPPAPPAPPEAIEASQRWIKVKWQPSWDGGDPIKAYTLSVNERVRYEGTELSCTVENLVEAQPCAPQI